MYIHLKSASTICTRFTGQFQCLFWSVFHFSYPKFSCKSLKSLKLKQTWSKQLMSDVLLKMFGSVISWPLFHFLLSFFLTSFSLPLIPHIHLSVSVRIFSTWNKWSWHKDTALLRISSISTSHPPSLTGLSLWENCFGVRENELKWHFRFKQRWFNLVILVEAHWLIKIVTIIKKEKWKMTPKCSLLK